MWEKLISLVEQVQAAITPEEFAAAKLLAESLLRHVMNDAPMPATAAELVADMQEGNRRVQAAPRFLVNELAKRISAATTAAVESDETIAAAILAKL